jgi:hypothetical protein
MQARVPFSYARGGKMSDINEARLAAIEKVLLAVLPWIDERVIEDAAATLRAELMTEGASDREATAQALQLLTDGRYRFKPPAVSYWLRQSD